MHCQGRELSVGFRELLRSRAILVVAHQDSTVLGIGGKTAHLGLGIVELQCGQPDVVAAGLKIGRAHV